MRILLLAAGVVWARLRAEPIANEDPKTCPIIHHWDLRTRRRISSMTVAAIGRKLANNYNGSARQRALLLHPGCQPVSSTQGRQSPSKRPAPRWRARGPPWSCFLLARPPGAHAGPAT